MATLRDTERLKVVQRLAKYETPTEVAEWASEAFDKDVSKQQVQHYDPTRTDKVADKWAKEFETTREQYLQNTRRIGIAQKTWRLWQYQDIAENADDPDTRLRAMKQAAKDVGDKFTNKTEIDHGNQDGEPLRFQWIDPDSVDE